MTRFGYSPELAERKKDQLDRDLKALEHRIEQIRTAVPQAGATVSRLDEIQVTAPGGGFPALSATDAPKSSPDAEVAAWRGDGPFIDLDDDHVAGWISPSSFIAALEAASRDDEDGIRAALVRREA